MYREDYLKKYVRLSVRVGAAITAGQALVISSPVECAYFARMAADEAYAAGAREVIMHWTDDKITRSRFLNADDEVFDEYPDWTKLLYTKLSAEGAAFMSIAAADPEALKGVDFGRIVRANKSAAKALKAYRKRTMGNLVQWCIVSVPSEAWAAKVFPDAPSPMERLWDAIYDASRIDDNDPVDNWKQHTSNIRRHVDILNRYNFKSLALTNSSGTDLTVELPEGHVWAGGGDTTHNGRDFLPNIPTEEVFTAPRRGGVNGVVVSSKPLVYGGNLIDGFSLTFKNGKVVDFTAKKNQDLLAKLLSSNKNVDYLGEIALVPFDSPISNTGVLFYNTLYDENASCHLALGQAYPDCIRDGSKLSPAMLTRAGLNQCATHHDFMIGTHDLCITGLTHGGEQIPVFVDGGFAF